MDALKLLAHTKLTHEALNTFARRAMAHIAGFQDDDFIVRQAEKIQTHVTEMDHAFQRILKDSFTRALNELDLRRDRILVALREALGSAISQDFLAPEKAKAAQQIMDLYRKMDSRVIQLSYNEESAQIAGFLTAVGTKLGESIPHTAGVSHLIQALMETQMEFDTTLNKRDNEDNNSDSPRKIREIRSDMTFRIESLLSYVRANGIDLPESYSETITNLNSLITEVMAKAKAEETRKENSPE